MIGRPKDFNMKIIGYEGHKNARKILHHIARINTLKALH